MALAHQPTVEDMSAEEVLGYMAERFHPRLYVAWSFQKEASVIMDMFLKIEPEARFFTLDTGLLFPETNATRRALEQRYGVAIDVHNGMSLACQAELYGDELWKRDPDACCGIHEVSALEQALSEVDGWITGVRREHSPSREATKLQWDSKHELWKANPLVDWSEKDVWRYIVEHDVPHDDLHDRGYASIGSTHCPPVGRQK